MILRTQSSRRLSISFIKGENSGNFIPDVWNDCAYWSDNVGTLFSRLPTIIKNFGNLQAAKHSDELRPNLPDTKRYITDNHNHLFEQPTVFYAIVIYIYLVEHVDSLHIMLAWAYFLFRVIHSIVHVTINNVSIRASVFVFSLACLVIMIAREGLFFLTL